MKFPADEWPKALERVLVGAIIFLTVLPAFGWTWHSVLPEHSHIFLNPSAMVEDDRLPEAQSLYSVSRADPNVCTDCASTQMRSGVAHLPSFDGLQILSTVAVSGTPVIIARSSDLVWHVFLDDLVVQSPVLLLLDPPPKFV